MTGRAWRRLERRLYRAWHLPHLTPREYVLLVAAGAVLMLAVVVTVAALDGPGGLVPALCPRRWRWWYRQHRGHGVRAAQRSGRIGARLQRMVERADRRRCVYCGARPLPGRHLAVDHMTPWIVGGLTALWNCALLCRACNTVKSAYWKAPGGRVYYRRGHRAPALAARILRAERRARRNPLRWARAFGLLPG